MASPNELANFKKSFLLHSSRYNLYSAETPVKGSTSAHNRAVKALGRLEEKVFASPAAYAELLAELLRSDEPKAALCAGFTCLAANLHTQEALETLAAIGKTAGISVICDFDIRGSITRFRKKQADNLPRNEVDALAEQMKNAEEGELLAMALKLPSIDMCGCDGRTALIHAAICGRAALAKLLIELGADINAADYSGKSALHCAAVSGSTEIARLLLDGGASVNAQDKRGFTALDFAKSAPTGDKADEMAKILLSHGAKTKQEINI